MSKILRKTLSQTNWQFLEIHGGKTDLDIFTWAFRRLAEKLACRGDPFWGTKKFNSGDEKYVFKQTDTKTMLNSRQEEN